MNGRYAALMVFAFGHIAYYMPYMALLILSSYLAFIIRDVLVFKAAPSSDWEVTTTIGKALQERQLLYERKVSQIEAFQPMPLEAKKPLRKHNLSLEDLQKSSSANFLSYHYLLDSEEYGNSLGIPLNRIQRLIFTRHHDFFRGAADYGSELSAELASDGISLSSTGISHLLTIPFVLESGEKDSFRVILAMGFQYEPDAQQLQIIEQKAQELSVTLYEEIFNRHTAQALIKRNNLMAHLGHDLRGPLNNIKSIVSFLAQDKSTAQEHADLFSSALLNCDQLSNIISDMLDFARFREGSLKAEKAQVHVSHAIEAVLNSFALQARQKQVTLRANVMDSIVLECDPNHFRRILSNLVSNSIKYAGPGSVCSVDLSLETNGNLLLCVADTGRGMTQDQLATLFTPYSRHHSEIAEGLGLGMTIFKILVELNGGKVSASSEQGVGTTISLRFPAVFVHSAPDSFADTMDKLTVLVLEDQPEIVNALVRALQHPRIEILRAYNLKEASSLIQERRPDVLLTDAELPDGRGIEAIQMLQQQVPLARCVVMTGSDDHVTQQAYQKLGVDHYLVKPVALEQVRSWLLSLRSKVPAAA